MRAVPVPFLAFLDWVQRHARAWAEHAPQIGVPVAVADDFSIATDRVTRAHTALEEARNALVTAQAEKDAAEAEARRQAGFIVSMIRSFAASKRSQGEGEQQEVLSLGQIEAVRVSSAPLPPPTEAGIRNATLEATTGHLTLRWEARQPRNARGTTYQVERSWRDVATGQRQRMYIGTAVGREFVDTTLPPGAVDITYRLTAQRSGKVGGVVEFAVKTAA